MPLSASWLTAVFGCLDSCLADDVERGHGKHVGGCEERSAAVVVRVRERAAEKGEVEGIAGDTRPDRFLRLLIRENRDAVTNLPHSHGAHEGAISVIVFDADQLRHRTGQEGLGHAEPDAEQPEKIRETFATGPAILIREPLIRGSRRCVRSRVARERAADVRISSAKDVRSGLVAK